MRKSLAMDFARQTTMGMALIWITMEPALADTLRILKSPILTASLPVGTSWQVETSENGGPWLASGVLVSGAASPVSVRMDGFHEAAAYRLTRTDNTANVTPVITGGFHLAGNAASASQLRIDESGDLAAGSWSQSALVFPEAGGNFLRIIRPPQVQRAFFRASVPASPAIVASVATYDADPTGGVAGFGPVADEMPAIYQNGFIAALSSADYNRGGANAAGAGECYELTGPGGTTTVIAGDYNPDSPPGTVDAGRGYLDLGLPAFLQVSGYPTGSTTGIATVSGRVVPAPVTGNLKLLVQNYFGGGYFELRVYNHRAGVSKLEVRNSGSANWVALPRSIGNSFAYSSASVGQLAAFPLGIRVTSRFDEVVEFPPVASLAGSQRIAGNAQFQVFPDTSPSPAWKLEPVYTDALSAIPGDSWGATPYSASFTPVFNGAFYQGVACARISNLASFGGVILSRYRPFPRPQFGILQFAIRSETTTTPNLGVSFSGSNAGVTVNTATLTLPPVTNTWRVYRIPLGSAGAPEMISNFRFVTTTSAGQPPILVDSISILQP